MTQSAMVSGNLLREVARLYTRAQRVVADCSGTSSTQCLLLTELGRSGPLPLSELGQRLRLEKSWISRAVDGLVKHGWATKEANPRDARSWLVTLTNNGTERVHELNRTLDAHAQQLLLCLAEPDRKAVETSLLLLFKALREDVVATCNLPAPERKKR